MRIHKLLPDAPGVYLMKDNADNIIYVGKALSLKNRVSQYFQKHDHDTKTRALLKNISDLEYIVTPTEVDALILESNLIKEHRPRYNIDLKDDKQYPFIKITINEDYPRIFITRKRLKDGARYFGPYTSARAMRETLRLITRVFKLPQCKKKFGIRSRPCLNYHMGLCSAPCSGSVNKTEYRVAVDEAIQFLEGKNKDLIHKLKTKMHDYVSKNDFEAAAVVRDQLSSIRTASLRQQVTGGFEDWDVISIAVSGEIASAQVLYIREGNLVGRSEFVLNSCGAEDNEVMGAFIKQYYSDAPVPGEILLDTMPDDATILEWLRSLGNVNINIPARGRKKELVEMANKNAQSLLKITLLKDEKMEKSGFSALAELQDVLSLNNSPEIIEGFDISNIGGTDAVGSMVVFKSGKPDKRQYRLFNIKTVSGIDDPAMMKEVISRRIAHIALGDDTPPDLMVVDGGATQVEAAMSALGTFYPNIPVIGLAKKFEHIYLPGADAPIILPHTSAALGLLKHLRDESHRFAVSHHRRRRSSRLKASILDDIPGVGKKRKSMLIKYFGSLDNIHAASIEDLKKVPGISHKMSREIFEKLQGSKSL